MEKGAAAAAPCPVPGILALAPLLGSTTGDGIARARQAPCVIPAAPATVRLDIDDTGLRQMPRAAKIVLEAALTQDIHGTAAPVFDRLQADRRQAFAGDAIRQRTRCKVATTVPFRLRLDIAMLRLGIAILAAMVIACVATAQLWLVFLALVVQRIGNDGNCGDAGNGLRKLAPIGPRRCGVEAGDDDRRCQNRGDEFSCHASSFPYLEISMRMIVRGVRVPAIGGSHEQDWADGSETGNIVALLSDNRCAFRAAILNNRLYRRIVAP